ncbi:MAG: radical SAM protein [Flexilinea sp.]
MLTNWESYFKIAEQKRINSQFQAGLLHNVTRELFFIPIEEDYLIYAPFQKIVLLVNRSAYEYIANIQAKNQFINLPIKDTFLQSLGVLGIIDGEADIYPDQSIEDLRKPTGVILFPTFDCNFRCKYCYSFGGEQPTHITWEIAKGAIDFVVQNAIERKISKFNVDFHGGGEPTRNWKVFVKSREYAIQVAQTLNLQTSSTIVTNCVLSQSQLEWIVENIKYLVASLDGPPYIQNSQRPLANGLGSYDLVTRSLAFFDKVGFPYGIRTTITTNSVRQMSAIVSHFCNNFGTRQLHFEPLFECGRCSVNDLTAPDPSVFVEEFIKASEIAEKFGATLYYSGARLGNLTDTFCNGAGRNFVVLPDGEVTACNEVCRSSDPRWKTFNYGCYDLEHSKFHFNNDCQTVIANRKVQAILICDNCFLKWHCAGECLVKSQLASNDLFIPSKERCWINQELGKDMLVQAIVNGKINGRSEIQITNIRDFLPLPYKYTESNDFPKILNAVLISFNSKEPWSKQLK